MRLRTAGTSNCVKTAQLVVLVIAAAGSLATAQAPAKDDTGAGIYKANCVICHGDDGAGTTLGTRLQVKDLRSKEVQDRSAAELAQAIMAGTDKMPAFKSRLDSDQIQKLIEFIREKKPKSP